MRLQSVQLCTVCITLLCLVSFSRLQSFVRPQFHSSAPKTSYIYFSLSNLCMQRDGGRVPGNASASREVTVNAKNRHAHQHSSGKGRRLFDIFASRREKRDPPPHHLSLYCSSPIHGSLAVQLLPPLHLCPLSTFARTLHSPPRYCNPAYLTLSINHA